VKADTIHLGRYTVPNDRGVVVFLIGIRFNGWRGLATALRTFLKMPPMLAELEREPALGLLDSRVALSWPVIAITQYWRSFDDLERFASSPDHSHAPAWRWFNRLGESKSSGVGIYHETYGVAPGAYEAIYGNMPRFGLARALDGHHRIAGRGEARARERASAIGG